MDRLPWLLLGLLFCSKRRPPIYLSGACLDLPLKVPGQFLPDASATVCHPPFQDAAIVPVNHCLHLLYILKDLSAGYVVIRHNACSSPLLLTNGHFVCGRRTQDFFFLRIWTALSLLMWSQMSWWSQLQFPDSLWRQWSVVDGVGDLCGDYYSTLSQTKLRQRWVLHIGVEGDLKGCLVCGKWSLRFITCN